MPAQHQDEYCHVNPKTGEILEGPMALPQNWGSVSGFCHLKDNALRKHNWFAVADDGVVRPGEPYEAVFLPERQLVVKVKSHGTAGHGRRQYALLHLYTIFAGAAGLPFACETPAGVFMFKNSPVERAQMQSCLLLKRDYTCMAQRLSNKQLEKVIVEYHDVQTLLEASADAYEAQADKMLAAMDDINSSTEEQIVAILDTNLADYYG